MKKTQKEREDWNKYFSDAHINQHDRDKAWKWIEKALSQKEEEVRREVLEEVWLEVRHSKPKFYGKDIDDETEQLIQDISYETKCQILDDIHELFPVKSKYSQEAPSPKYDKTK